MLHYIQLYKYLFALLLTLTFICAIRQTPVGKISIKGKWFVDEYGRVKIFHGINAVRKELPWTPTSRNNNMTNETQLDYLKQWGFNAVRLGYMWSGVKPDKDTVNQKYIDSMSSIINDLASRGIYVIIDMHQDMMSSKFFAYDGVPKWVLDLMPNSTFPYPWPFKRLDLGFTAYLTEACGFAFQCLYNNINKFQDYFSEFWSITAQSLSNYSSVLGYEFINEPWAGDIYRHPDLLLPARAGHNNLMPMYDNVYEIIRKYDEKTIVFYEPVTWGVIFDGNVWGTGFERAPGNDPNRTALSWHYYCWLLQFSPNPLKNDTYPLFDRVLCDDFQRKSAFNSVQNDMKKIGGPSFLTEFGVCAFDMGNGTLVTDECKYVLDAADEYLQSWTYWNADLYTTFDLDVNYQIVDILSRVYPMSTAGIPVSLYYNTTTKLFIYEYTVDPTIQVEPTEIFIPDRAYPQNSFQISVSDHLQWTFDKESRLIYVTLVPNWTQSFQAKVMIMPTKYNYT